jgi:putative glutamine amidotransferase
MLIMSQPIIGITSTLVKYNFHMEGVYVHQDYHRSVLECGGLPIVLPLVDSANLIKLINLCDGVIFSGGEDVDPAFYHGDPHQKLGETISDRDEAEIEGIRHTIAAKKPILAICRGTQILNVALGGTLIQDIPSENSKAMQHDQPIARGRDWHWVDLEENCYLSNILEQSRVRVNSLHHQAIDRLADRLTVVGRAPDGIIEAVEMSELPFGIGVQWHPESQTQHGDAVMKKLFQAFVNQCRLQK